MSVAGTYAEALYQSAHESGAVDAVAGDLQAFAAAVEDSADLRGVLMSPDVDSAAKKAVVAAITEDAHDLLRNFLQVLIDRGRIAELPDIARAVERRVAEAQGRLEVEIVTAVPLTDDLRARIAERVRRDTGRDVDLSESVDPEILGGLVLRVGGVVVDDSVRRRLASLGDALRSARVDADAVIVT